MSYIFVIISYYYQVVDQMHICTYNIICGISLSIK